MAWQSDIIEATYTSPSGKEFSFLYESVQVDVDRKTAEFTFAEKDGAYIQDLGIAGRSFPFTLFFVGDSYNKTADKFLKALEEKGIGYLEHPLYGGRYVVPTGKVTRRDDLVTETNQAIFTVTFSETIRDIFFPSSQTDALSSISDNLDALQAAQASKFSLDIAAKTIGDKIKLATRMAKQLQKFNKIVKDFIRFTNETKAQFETVKTAYENAIDGVFDNAETVARMGIELIRTPAKIVSDFQSKAQIFKDCFSEIGKDFVSAISANNFFATNVNLTGYVAASCEGALFSEFKTRNDVILASESILELLDGLKEFQDNYIIELGIIDTGEDYAALQTLISNITGYLISISFDLPSQKSVILGEETNIIPLCAELYGTLDKLDYLIETNDLTADEIEILSIGKEIFYYE